MKWTERTSSAHSRPEVDFISSRMSAVPGSRVGGGRGTASAEEAGAAAELEADWLAVTSDGKGRGTRGVEAGSLR